MRELPLGMQCPSQRLFRLLKIQQPSDTQGPLSRDDEVICTNSFPLTRELERTEDVIVSSGFDACMGYCKMRFVQKP